MRQIIRQRDAFRCLYCGMREVNIGAELTIDHYQPRSQGGSDDPSNLIYCCHACNEFKGGYWQPGAIQRIINPLIDDIAAHLYEDENGSLQHLTDTGAFHIEQLQLNRNPLIAFRQEQQRIKADAEHLKVVHQHTSLLMQEMGALRIEIDQVRSMLERYLL